jgi:hypothetical protein
LEASGTQAGKRGGQGALDGALQFIGKRPVPALTITGRAASSTVRYPARMIGSREHKGAGDVPFISFASNLPYPRIHPIHALLFILTIKA